MTKPLYFGKNYTIFRLKCQYKVHEKRQRSLQDLSAYFISTEVYVLAFGAFSIPAKEYGCS